MSICFPRGTRATVFASVFTLGLNLPSQAADVTTAQANDVAQQLRTWLAGLLANRVPISPEMLMVVPAGESYNVSVRFPGGFIARSDEAGKPTDAWLTAIVRPEQGTRWRIESMKLPATFRLTPEAAAALGAMGAMGAMDADEPLAPKPPNDQKEPPAAPVAVPSMEWQTRTQTASGVFDTAQASDSRLEYRMEGIKYEARNLGGSPESHVTVERIAGLSMMHPTPSGAVDFAAEGVMDGYTSVSTNPIIGSVRVSAKRVVGRGAMGAVMTSQLADLIRTVVTLGMDANAAKESGTDLNGKDEKAARAAVRTMIAQLKGIMGGAKLEETFEGIEVQAGDGRGSAEQAGFSFGGDAPADKLQAFTEFSATSLKIQGTPPQYADFVPRSFVVRPTVANIDVKGLTKLAEDASADGADPDEMQARLLNLVTNSGVRLGFEHLDVDLGFASMVASGTATVVGPNAYHGQADVTVMGLDDLMQRVQKLPDSGQALAVLAMAKGIGKADGKKTTWHIAMSEDSKVMINGMDMSKMGRK